MKKLLYLSTTGALLIPAVPVLAAPPENFKEFINSTLITGILKPTVSVLIILALIVFIYGVILVMFSEGGEKKEGGKMYMFWGVIGMFVIVSVWGIVSIIQNIFGLNNTPLPVIQMTVPATQQEE